MDYGNQEPDRYVPSHATEKAPVTAAMSKKIICIELRYIMILEILIAIATIIIIIAALATPVWLR
jgi:hypothetical protein